MVTELEKKMAEAILKKYGGDRLTALATVMDLKDIIDKCLGSNDWDEDYRPDDGSHKHCAPDCHDHSLPGDGEYIRVDKICYWVQPCGVRIMKPSSAKSNWNIRDGGRIIVSNEPKKSPDKIECQPNSKMVGSQIGDIELFSYFPWTFFVEICDGARLDISRGVIHPDGSGEISLRKSPGKNLLSGDLFLDQRTGFPRYFSIQTSVYPGNPIFEDLICTGLHFDPRKSSCVEVDFIKAK